MIFQGIYLSVSVIAMKILLSVRSNRILSEGGYTGQYEIRTHEQVLEAGSRRYIDIAVRTLPSIIYNDDHYDYKSYVSDEMVVKMHFYDCNQNG